MQQSVLASLGAGPLLHKLLDLLTPDFLRSLLLLYKDLRAFIQKERGLYEILEYESTLDLLDGRGKMARLTKCQRVKFLQDSVLAFQDYGWGDGETFASYACSPGVVVDRYQEGDRWNVLISLRETKNSGDIEEFHIQRCIKGGFTGKEEWSQVEIRHKTRRLRMRVIFPKGRPCRSARLITRSQHTSRTLGSEHLRELPDGRQQLTWETRDIKQMEVYTLKWRW
jgi:hypothetical protein